LIEFAQENFLSNPNRFFERQRKMFFLPPETSVIEIDSLMLKIWHLFPLFALAELGILGLETSASEVLAKDVLS
jgi:hypothetical protein